MRILELQLRNYRVFDEVDLEVPARVIGIFGENGAGKSTLMESIAFSLYGVDGARTKRDGIRTHGVLTDCETRMVFEHGGAQYEVRRALRGRNHTPAAELYVGGSQLATGVSEVDAEIQRLLHMDLRVFRASVFAEQKQLDAFSDLTASKRKEMALRLLGIKPVDDARAAARREARSTSQRASDLLGAVTDITALEAQLKEAIDMSTDAVSRLTASSRATVAAERAGKAARKAFEDSDRVRQRVEKLRVALDAAVDERARLARRHGELATRAGSLRAELAHREELEALAATLEDVDERLRGARRWADASTALANAEAQLDAMPTPDVESSLAELQAAEDSASAAEAAAAAARATADRAARDLEAAEQRVARAADADPSEPCPTCGQELGEGFRSYVRHARRDASGAKAALAAATAEVKRADAVLVKARKARERARAAGEDVRSSTERRAALQQRVDEHRAEVGRFGAPFGGEEPDIPALEADARRAVEVRTRLAELAVHQGLLTQTEHDLADAEVRANELEAKIEAGRREAEGLSFDEIEHGRRRQAADDAEAALEQHRADERAASAAAADAARLTERLTGQLEQARETERKVDDLRSEARVLDRVSVLLDGFRDHLVARVGPELSREAEALFAELTNHDYSALKIDDDDLSIRIADGDTYFPIERFSGSESDLANLALRVAISSHLSRVSGADVGLMVLDEVLGSLDQERKDLMVRAMGGLASRLHQLFVITHSDQVKDQFPATIQIAKVGRRRSTAVLV